MLNRLRNPVEENYTKDNSTTMTFVKSKLKIGMDPKLGLSLSGLQTIFVIELRIRLGPYRVEEPVCVG